MFEIETSFLAWQAIPWILTAFSTGVAVGRAIGASISEKVTKKQSRLFGMHMKNEDIKACHGHNKWWLKDEEGTRSKFYDKGKPNIPLPPFDWKGLMDVQNTLIENDRYTMEIRDHIQKTEIKNNCLVVGGTRINETVKRLSDVYKNDLPYGFVSDKEIPRDLMDDILEEPPPPRFDRFFADESEKIYTKISKTGWYLTDRTRIRRQKPFGPIVSHEGEIKKDVILLTIMPADADRHKLTVVQAGYGGGSCLREMLYNYKILSKLYNAVDGQQDPWLQAVLECKVTYKDGAEHYEISKIPVVKPLPDLAPLRV
jgi:hypothetical protein